MSPKQGEETLKATAEFFKILGDYTRIRILDSLLDKELSVSQICEELAMKQSAISHQLRTLKNFNLVNDRRQGKEIYYSLSDEHIHSILSQGKEHIEE